MIKVRATQDGVYGGYYYYGPVPQENGTMKPGDVFEVDDMPYELKDESGRLLQEMQATGELNDQGYPKMKPVWVLDSNGKPKKDAHGNLVPKIRTASFFSSEWMEIVSDETEVTNDYPPIERIREFGPLSVYQEKKKKPAPVKMAMPQVPVESPI